jgi:hypothetical protein
MKKLFLILIIILTILILFFIAMGIFYFLNPKYKITETKTFSEIPGFSFDYPVFKGWESDKLKIEKSEYPYKGPNGSSIDDNPNIKTNENGVKYYMNLRKNSENSLGLPFINFYSSDSIVTIYPFMHEGDGYSAKVFADKIIETFKFSQ